MSRNWHLLEYGKCKFCGADNTVDRHPYIKVVDHYVYCDNCSARTISRRTKDEAIEDWKQGNYSIPIQSERQIYQECLNLMHGLVENFNEWLDWQGIKVPEEEKFCVTQYPTQIVNRLFLYHTSHSGGTSTRAKCEELGIEDCTKSIIFEVEEDEQ